MIKTKKAFAVIIAGLMMGITFSVGALDDSNAETDVKTQVLDPNYAADGALDGNDGDGTLVGDNGMGTNLNPAARQDVPNDNATVNGVAGNVIQDGAAAKTMPEQVMKPASDGAADPADKNPSTGVSGFALAAAAAAACGAAGAAALGRKTR